MRLPVQPALHGLEDIFVLPAGDAPLFGRRALGLERAALAAGQVPVAVQREALLDARHAAGERFACGAAVGVLLADVDEVLLAEAAVGLGPGGQRPGDVRRGPGLFAAEDLLA